MIPLRTIARTTLGAMTWALFLGWTVVRAAEDTGSADAFGAIGSIIDRYGLPLAILTGLLWLLLSRRLVLGSEATYIEARRAEERERAIAAEALVRDLTDAVEKLANGVDGLPVVVAAAVEKAIAASLPSAIEKAVDQIERRRRAS